MCDMPIPFGAEFDPSASGSFEQSSPVNEVPKPSQIEPIRSAYVPRYAQSNNLQTPIYHPPRKSVQAAESFPNFSYYPGSYAPPSFPQQEHYFAGPATNPQSMHQMYGRESSTNYHQQQLPSYQYQPVQLKPRINEQYYGGMIDSRVAHGSYDMRMNSHATCENCGSFCSSSSFNPNFVPVTNNEPQRFAAVGGNAELNRPSRPYRFYYPPNSTNRKHRYHMNF